MEAKKEEIINCLKPNGSHAKSTFIDVKQQGNLVIIIQMGDHLVILDIVINRRPVCETKQDLFR